MENNSYMGNNASVTDDSYNTERIYRPETIIIANCALNAPLIPVAIIGNALVLAAILKTPSINSRPTMIMLSSLAVSDLLVGFISQPLYIAKEITKDPLLSTIWDTLGYSLCGVSLLIITAISVDRFIALSSHLRYPTIVTKPCVRFTVAVIWLVNFSSSGVYFWNELAYHLVLAVITGICLAISTFAYIKIYRIVHLHHVRICAQHQALETLDVGNTMHMKQIVKSTMSTFVFYIFMIACYFPMYVLLTLYGVTQGQKIWRKEWNFATTVVMMNSSINPFLYYWRLRDLRMAVVKTTKTIFCRGAREE